MTIRIRATMSVATFLLSLVSLTTARVLDENGYSSSYSSFSSSSLKFNKCFRIKIPDENEDEGNSYFYNGAYRSQSRPYASFYLCENGCGDSCDTSKGYVIELRTFLEPQVNFVQQYCYSCQTQCARRLDDGGNGQQADSSYYAVDCDSCGDVCSLLINKQNEGKDESQFLQCQAAYADENGIQYYYGPGCSDDGRIIIRLWYDADCTIRASDGSGYSKNFAYNTFGTIQRFCTDCSMTDVCSYSAQQSFECVDGVNVNQYLDDSEMRVCKNFKEAMKEWKYAPAKKKSPVPIILFCMIVLSTFLFGAYTYYIRHKKSSTSSKAEQFEETKRPIDTEYVGMT